MDEAQSLSIGELAAATGVLATTIRFYEERGVLPPARRAPNGYRVYDEADVARLRFVRGARALDFETEEVRSVLALRDEGRAPCEHVITLLAEKVALVEARLRELKRTRAELAALLAAAESLPRDDLTMEGCICSLIREREEEGTAR